jgi:hypothetical protein
MIAPPTNTTIATFLIGLFMFSLTTRIARFRTRCALRKLAKCRLFGRPLASL